MHREDRQQRPELRAVDHHRAIIGAYLKRTEDPDVHRCLAADTTVAPGSAHRTGAAGGGGTRHAVQRDDHLRRLSRFAPIGA
jgi:hypothetical protein